MAPLTNYIVGDAPRLTGTFKNSAGSASDPSGIVFKIREPDGALTTYTYGTDAELVRSSTGVYYVDWPVAKVGAHYFEFGGTGSVVAVQDAVFTARASQTA